MVARKIQDLTKVVVGFFVLRIDSNGFLVKKSRLGKITFGCSDVT